MIDVKVEGLPALLAKIERIGPAIKSRVTHGALREGAEAYAQEGNRRVHSPAGRARTFKVFVHNDQAYVSPGSRANFFSQMRYPILPGVMRAATDRVTRVMEDAVEAGLREALR